MKERRRLKREAAAKAYLDPDAALDVATSVLPLGGKLTPRLRPVAPAASAALAAGAASSSAAPPAPPAAEPPPSAASQLHALRDGLGEVSQRMGAREQQLSAVLERLEAAQSELSEQRKKAAAAAAASASPSGGAYSA